MATCFPSRKLYKLDEPDTQDTAGEARTNSSVMYFYRPPHMAKQKQDDQLEHTYSSYVRIRDVALKTYQRRWMTGRSGERGSGISVQAARHDDDDDDEDSPNVCPGYDTKQSDAEASIMLEFWGMQSTPSLPSLPGPLWPGVVAPDKVLSMGQIELFNIWIECQQMTYAKLNCLEWNSWII